MTSGNGRREEAPDPEVVPVAKRRHFSAKEKLRILEEADRCEYGEIGALVRREGIYTSYLSRWRRERERGQLEALGQKQTFKGAVSSIRAPHRPVRVGGFPSSSRRRLVAY